jgi:transcriptional regulator with PAS, ATPase and Fis domain
MPETPWFDSLPGAVTVCNCDGFIIYMNQVSKDTFSNGDDRMIGQSIYDCHSPDSVRIIQELLQTGISNSYTISKKGVRKFIHQTPFFQNGEVAGLVEFSFVIPEDLPHHNRD